MILNINFQLFDKEKKDDIKQKFNYEISRVADSNYKGFIGLAI